jgi:holo-[acyl-carrier protein] synthase
MIYGVGIDMIEVERVAQKVSKNNGFTEKVFSRAEIAYCKASANPAENFAVRFAAKEAFLKATGKGLLFSHELHEIEVCNDDLGKPFLMLHNGFAAMAKDNNWHFHISLSHLSSAACAVVIIEI